MPFRDPTPRPHLPEAVDFGDVPMVGIVATPAEANRLQGYLRAHDFYLYAVPTSDGDLPTYGIAAVDRRFPYVRPGEASSAAR